MGNLPYDPREVGLRVAALRRALDMSQADFARSIGAQAGEVGSWEAGMRRPSIAKVKPLVDRYGVTLDWLFLGDPERLPYGLARKILSRESEGVQPDQG